VRSFTQSRPLYRFLHGGVISSTLALSACLPAKFGGWLQGPPVGQPRPGPTEATRTPANTAVERPQTAGVKIRGSGNRWVAVDTATLSAAPEKLADPVHETVAEPSPALAKSVVTIQEAAVEVRAASKAEGQTSAPAVPAAPPVKKPASSVASVLDATVDTSWGYVLPVDFGIRNDRAGAGSFRAPRRHGEHNGVDLLAPVGTPALAPCSGKAKSGENDSFGKWVHLVCRVPVSLARKQNLFASIFFAHLDSTVLSGEKWTRVNRGDGLGKVGKTGNAAHESVQPHLHLELIIRETERAAMDEEHRGLDQSNDRGADAFIASLEDRCLEPSGLTARSRMVRRTRRADPFLVLVCLGDKPEYRPASGSLANASRPWSSLYSARGFDVNAGPSRALIAP
jgi:murein DD-endopeptidase MepM/ murein hydrolase activator NlpD